MSELTLTQQKQILENLVMDEVEIPGLPPISGEYAAITEIATEITNNTHFLYDRSQRAWIEMGESGRLIGSLVVFPRSVLQRTIIQAKVLDPAGWAPPLQKKRAMKVLLAMLFGSLGANYLFAKAYRATLLSLDIGVENEKVLRLIDLLTRTVDRTGIGQALEMEARSSDVISPEHYMRIVTEKTGYYLAYSIVGGAIISGVPDDVLKSLRNFGMYVGPVFQVVDDILDLSESKGREEIGCDIKEGKRSLLVALATSECTSDERQTLYSILNKRREETTEEDISWVVSLFDRYDIVGKAKESAGEMLGGAKAAIKNVPQQLRENLSVAADFFFRRRV